MRKHKKIGNTAISLCAALLCMMFPCRTEASVVVQGSMGSLKSVTEESQVLPISDGSGKYLLKSDGFYCLNEDGTRANKTGIHYFDHFVIDGTEFNGYYYHDETGKFKAGSPHMVYINKVSLLAEHNENYAWAQVFDGYYMVNNLGKLTAAPQIRYMDNLVLNGKTFNGYYYFDETGRMVTEPGIHYIDMTSNGQRFQGDYYFGGTDGGLVQESGITPEGFPVDETGKVGEAGMENLQSHLESMLSGYQGEWSVYVKDLNTEEEILINDKSLYSASLIKAFVMAKTYQDLAEVQEHEGEKINASPDSDTVRAKVDDLLWNMITVSDNESSNELVRLQSEKLDFLDGAAETNKYLEQEGYTNTTVQHTLAPSSSPSIGLGGNNRTSVRDCGILLERIYKGECVSEEASAAMLNLLLNQQVTWKIPEGLSGVSGDIKIANKTGETTEDQHDIAIVYGEKTTYILCVMSEGCPSENTAINNIRDISRSVYSYLNL